MVGAAPYHQAALGTLFNEYYDGDPTGCGEIFGYAERGHDVGYGPHGLMSALVPYASRCSGGRYPLAISSGTMEIRSYNLAQNPQPMPFGLEATIVDDDDPLSPARRDELRRGGTIRRPPQRLPDRVVPLTRLTIILCDDTRTRGAIRGSSSCPGPSALAAAGRLGNRRGVSPKDPSQDARAPALAAAVAIAGCIARTLSVLARRRLHQPTGNVGSEVRFADGTSAQVYRETTIDAGVAEPCVLIVGFRLRWVGSAVGHRLFRAESLLNTVLFAGFTGFRSKLWLRHDQTGRYRGIYQWDGPAAAEAYVRALWWPLALVSHRDSIKHVVLPARWRDDVATAPPASEQSGQWWRVVSTPPITPRLAAADPARAQSTRPRRPHLPTGR